jgi:hypothetical protein
MTFEQAVADVSRAPDLISRRELVADWLSDLRRRTDVVILRSNNRSGTARPLLN